MTLFAQVLRLDRATEAAVSVTGPAGPAELLDEWLHHQEGGS
jgi:hypothetical protein